MPHDEPPDGRPASDRARSGRPEPAQAGETTPRLRVREEAGDGLSAVLRLRVDGELDVDTATGLRDDLAVLAARSTVASLVLDLSGVTFCDTASLYTLLGIRRTLPLTGVDVRLVEPGVAVRTAAG
ncbi:STAS domain-containing protein, partial [Streptomyces sp. TRM76130]|nr:STAS domain-containing protein [Streptomyces sp. TRM76130]